MKSIRTCINYIGEEFVKDTFTYPDIICKPKEGIIPRCLILEEEAGNPNARGSIVVGINPGRSTPRERKYYCERACTYTSVKEYWEDHLHNHPYYQRLREFLNQARRRRSNPLDRASSL